MDMAEKELKRSLQSLGELQSIKWDLLELDKVYRL